MSAEPPTPPNDGSPTAEQTKTGLVTRVKASAGSVKNKAEGVFDDLERRRPNNRIIDVAFGSAEYESTAGGGILAGAVAFRFFLFIVPYVFFVVLAFGIGADASGKDPVDLARSTGIVGLAASAINASSGATWFTRITTLLIVLYALLSGSRTLVKSLRAVHCLIWRVPFVKLQKQLVKGLAAIGLLTLMLLIVRFEDLLKDTSFFLWIVALVLSVSVPAAMWLFCIVTVLPSAPGTTWRDLWPGALLFGVGIQLLHVVTVVWIARSLESKSETYGALGAALTILLWAYLLGRLVTASASLNAVMWREKQQSLSLAAGSADATATDSAVNAGEVTGEVTEEVVREELTDELLPEPHLLFGPPTGPAQETVPEA